MEWKIDAKSGIRYRDPEDADQPVFYVRYLTRATSRGYAPMIYWYEWKIVGPFTHQDALKHRKRLNGCVTKDPIPSEDSSWHACWYNHSDYARDERYPPGHPLRLDHIHYSLA